MKNLQLAGSIEASRVRIPLSPPVLILIDEQQQMRFLSESLTEMVEDAITAGLNAQQIDALVVVSAGNALRAEEPVPALKIEVPNAESFGRFIEGAEVKVIMIGGITRFISIFPRIPDGFPIARVYTHTVFLIFLSWHELEDH